MKQTVSGTDFILRSLSKTRNKFFCFGLAKTYYPVVLLLFVWLAVTTTVCADGTKHYLAFASDRHNNYSATDGVPVVNTAMGVWKDLPVEYVSLIGDMVGSGYEAPPYDVSEVWTEVHSLFPDLPLDQFSIIWGSHDGGFTDNQNLGIMKLPHPATSYLS